MAPALTPFGVTCPEIAGTEGCRGLCHHPGLPPRRAGDVPQFPGRLRRDSAWLRRSETSPSPTAFSSTATFLRHGKSLFFAGRGMEGNGQVLMPPVGQEGEKPRVFYRVELHTVLRLQVVGPLIFSLFGSFSFPGTCFSPRRRRLPGPAQLCEARDGRGLWPRPAAGGVSSAEQSWLPVRAHPWPGIPAGHMVWNARGISPRRHLRRLLSLCQGVLDSRLPRRGQEEVEIWGRAP